MIKNYIKIGWKVLMRRKFFTFISLFGISITLMILMVITSLLEYVIGPKTPEKKLDRMLFVTTLYQQNKDGGNYAGPSSYFFMDKFVKTLKLPEKVAIHSIINTANSYAENKKVRLDQKLTDSEFWEIMDFDFIEGKGFSPSDVANANNVVVINEETRNQCFGNTNVVGKFIDIDNVKYRVIGVVENVSSTRIHSYADIWTPINVLKENKFDRNYAGNFTATILANNSSDLPLIQDEFKKRLNNWENPDPEKFVSLKAFAETIPQALSRVTLGNHENDNVGLLYAVIIGLMVLFMVLPAINLINVNISRIMERTSEIGLRKAFGATRYALIGQFIVENIFLTLIGGIFGFMLSAIVLYMISESQIIPYANFTLNFKIFFYGLFFALFFGFISGVYPALKMSRLQAIEALKGGKL